MIDMYKRKLIILSLWSQLLNKILIRKKLKCTQTHHMRIRILYLHDYIINYLLLKCKQSRE